MLHRETGIHMADTKRQLVLGRLTKRLELCGCETFSEYLKRIASGDQGELRVMVDLLTTNETSFFREPANFDFLREIIRGRNRPRMTFSAWSAACSSGEEPYTIAMVLSEALGNAPWDVLGTDISTRILERAKSGHYAIERASSIRPELVKRYCLKGVRSQEGTFLIAPELRDHVRFAFHNLMQPVPEHFGMFDVIFLRNTLIYFDQESKRKVIGNLLPKLRSGGHFIVGHSETLNGITDQLVARKPSIYLKP